MIVGNLHVIAVTIAPNETDAPLIIDPDRVLSLAISPQGLQLISRGRSQDAQFRCSVELEQFSEGNALDRVETLAVLIMEKLLRALRAEAPDHT